jgi:hypothetical protein
MLNCPYAECHYTECLYAEHHVLFIVMINFTMLRVVMLICPNAECHYAKCPYAECHVLFIVLQNAIMLNVLMLSVIILCIVFYVCYVLLDQLQNCAFIIKSFTSVSNTEV